ncbi:hypothetical protein PMAYCL1PPCAC_22867, partial [Pristionchus mayeri]
MVRSRCTAATPSGKNYHQTIGVRSVVILTLEVFTMAAYRRLLHKNKAKLAKGCETLTERYQLTENIRSLEYLVPAVTSTIVLNISAVFIFVLISSLPL